MQSKIHKVLLALGDNVVLRQAEKTPWFNKFHKKLIETIRDQVEEVTSNQALVDELINLTFKADNFNIVNYLKNHFTNLRDKFNSITSKGKFSLFFWNSENAGGQAALDELNYGVKFLNTNESVINFFTNRENLLIDSVDTTTKTQIARIIEQGKKDLLTNREIAKLINQEFTEISMVRAGMIAHTELNNAVSQVELETFRRNDVDKKRWVTCLDDRVSQRDMAMHGQVVNINEDFFSDYDGWSGQSPPSHVNCILGGQEVFGLNVSSKFVSDYDGPIITITTAKGSSLAVTPNHFVLTGRGWIKASEIKTGDCVINVGEDSEEMAFSYPSTKPIKSMIEDISVSNKNFITQTPISVVDFHGDEVFCKNINIIKLSPGLEFYFKIPMFLNYLNSLTKSFSEIVLKKLIKVNPSSIFFDKIVSIKKGHFKGKVYDLETKGHWYTTNNIVTHNCRCRPEAVFSDYVVQNNNVVWSGSLSKEDLGMVAESNQNSWLTKFEKAINAGDSSKAQDIVSKLPPSLQDRTSGMQKLVDLIK